MPTTPPNPTAVIATCVAELNKLYSASDQTPLDLWTKETKHLLDQIVHAGGEQAFSLALKAGPSPLAAAKFISIKYPDQPKMATQGYSSNKVHQAYYHFGKHLGYHQRGSHSLKACEFIIALTACIPQTNHFSLPISFFGTPGPHNPARDRRARLKEERPTEKNLKSIYQDNIDLIQQAKSGNYHRVPAALNQLVALHEARPFPTEPAQTALSNLAQRVLACGQISEHQRCSLITRINNCLQRVIKSLENRPPFTSFEHYPRPTQSISKIQARLQVTITAVKMASARQAHTNMVAKLASCSADLDLKNKECQALIASIKQSEDIEPNMLATLAKRADLTADQKHVLIFELIYQLYYQEPECRSLLNANAAVLTLLQSPIDHRFVIHLLVEFQQYFQQPVTPVRSTLFSIVAEAQNPLNSQQQEAILMLTKTAIESGEDLTERNGKGDTILHAICRKTNDVDFVNELHQAGIPSSIDDRGRFPCTVANEHGNTRIAQLLNIRYHNGQCKLETIVQGRPITKSFVTGILAQQNDDMSLRYNEAATAATFADTPTH